MFRGEKVGIRPLERSDLEWFTEWNNDLTYTGPYEPLEINSLDRVEKWYDSEKNAEWWVIVDELDNPVGQLVAGQHGDCYWIGYIMHPDHRGKGYMTDAVKLLVDYIFRTKQIVRVQAECSPDNLASVRVLEKAGFTYEGLRRKAVFIQGRYLDGAMYSILRDEWTPYMS
jgi:ribosomal-protein-alanine N-acetyltransferase